MATIAVFLFFRQSEFHDEQLGADECVTVQRSATGQASLASNGGFSWSLPAIKYLYVISDEACGW